MRATGPPAWSDHTSSESSPSPQATTTRLPSAATAARWRGRSRRRGSASKRSSIGSNTSRVARGRPLASRPPTSSTRPPLSATAPWPARGCVRRAPSGRERPLPTSNTSAVSVATPWRVSPPATSTASGPIAVAVISCRGVCRLAATERGAPSAAANTGTGSCPWLGPHPVTSPPTITPSATTDRVLLATSPSSARSAPPRNTRRSEGATRAVVAAGGLGPCRAKPRRTAVGNCCPRRDERPRPRRLAGNACRRGGPVSKPCPLRAARHEANRATRARFAAIGWCAACSSCRARGRTA